MTKSTIVKAVMGIGLAATVTLAATACGSFHSNSSKAATQTAAVPQPAYVTQLNTGVVEPMNTAWTTYSADPTLVNEQALQQTTEQSINHLANIAWPVGPMQYDSGMYLGALGNLVNAIQANLTENLNLSLDSYWQVAVSYATSLNNDYLANPTAQAAPTVSINQDAPAPPTPGDSGNGNSNGGSLF